MNERQRLVWVMSSLVCAAVNYAMQRFAGVSYQTSEQHKDTSVARQDRELYETKLCLDFLPEIHSHQVLSCRVGEAYNRRGYPGWDGRPQCE